jgi:hypothetical protein
MANGALPGFGAVALLLLFFALLLFYVFPAFMGLRSGQNVAARVQEVRASGELLGQTRCAGVIGGVGLGVPGIIGVEVYPGGLVIQYLNKSPVAIRDAELLRIERLKWSRRTEITHRSPDIGAPVLLNISADSIVAGALSYFVHASPQRNY